MTTPSHLVGNADTTFWLFNPTTGYDLTHPATPSSPPVATRLRLATTADVAVTIAPAKTAPIVIDMQNFFLSEAIARAAGIQIVHVVWGITEEGLAAVPGGRLLMRDQWNTALHKPLQDSFDLSQSTALPDRSF
ncbi:hypothetical protein B0T25DRAFT_577340 [Lasiosphaeria hispida]|uniref:Isochorismatase-like domain-containing protein n=1 Tax=Lasiosphaeria hispida TaxID=260671 RepID=A0AAJ0HPV8_9PEZI|nr:hypothetical protein B0T25DRAFT_577340 [Lasiosphaeria hispida]